MAGPIPSARSSADACPGALRPHHAADGDLVRLRLPGGALSPSELGSLLAASTAFGDGRLGLTSRGNVQIRGVAPGAADDLAAWVRAEGLLPSLTHERVRNIVASPLSGRLPASLGSVDALASDLDAARCLRPGLADLPGRFLFAVDDGTGDVAELGADVLLRAMGEGRVAVQLPGSPEVAGRGGHALVVPEECAIASALAVAEDFLAEREALGLNAWRISELPEEAVARIAAALARQFPQNGEMVVAERFSRVENDQLAVLEAGLEGGLEEQVGGLFALCALVPLGVLSAEQGAAVVAAAGLSSAEPHAALRVTPWRRIVIRDLEVAAALAARELLAAYGLVVDGDTAWNRVTACAGRPGCAKSLADVHSDARAFVAHAVPSGGAVHWAGCERGCGTPSGAVAVAIATGSGYALTGGGQLSASEQAWIGAR